MGCDCITSCFVFKISLVFHFSIDSLQNLTILLFTPTNSNMKLVTTKFKSGELHEKHVVATWNLGNHLSICF